MIGKPGPFQVIESDSLDIPHDPPKRRYSCAHYESCLNLAAALNWDSFTCRGCCGQVNESLFWRARQAYKKDSLAKSICTMPAEQVNGSLGDHENARCVNGSDLERIAPKVFNILAKRG